MEQMHPILVVNGRQPQGIDRRGMEGGQGLGLYDQLLTNDRASPLLLYGLTMNFLCFEANSVNAS